MNIIFGRQQAQELANLHTVLELDTFQIGVNGPVETAYCVVEVKLLEDMLTLAENQERHQLLIKAYQAQEWSQALELLDQLTEAWDGELDSFYLELRGRVQNYMANPPDQNWTPVIQK